MKAPLSWIQEYVKVKSDPRKLGDRLTEIGLGTEHIDKIGDDYIFDLEITPNRPDWLSMLGVAREVAAIENTHATLPKVKTDVTHEKPAKELPLTIKTDPDINPRFTGIIIDGVKVDKSPQWLVERLEKVGQRSINNVVDITNYVMLELGNPIHAFDYDKVAGHTMEVKQAKGGEEFKSVDGLMYHLPKGAVIIWDKEKVIDLCGIKGGENTGTYTHTKTIFIRVPVEQSVLIRRTSQMLGLRSEASSIFERGVNAGGTVDTLNRCVDLILQYAGGEIASKLYDLKKQNFEPWKLTLRLPRLNKILGIEISKKQVLDILDTLTLSPKQTANEKIEVTVPTYRNDLKLEEDLIEEVARLYGYNNFPKTLPSGQIPTTIIPYFRDYRQDEKVKRYITGTGFSEVYTYSLIGEKELTDIGIQSEKVLRVDNPVSREFEYLRPTLKSNLIKALKQNLSYEKKINLFELGKVYKGTTIDNAEELYMLSGITNEKSFAHVKGMLQRLFNNLGVDDDPTPAIEIIDEGIFFEIDYTKLIKKVKVDKVFVPLPKFPPIIEDLAFVVAQNIKVGQIIAEIKKQSPIIADVSLLDVYEDTKTFHIIYQNKEKNLTMEDVAKIREKIIKALQDKFHARLKD